MYFVGKSVELAISWGDVTGGSCAKGSQADYYRMSSYSQCIVEYEYWDGNEFVESFRKSSYWQGQKVKSTGRGDCTKLTSLGGRVISKAE